MSAAFGRMVDERATELGLKDYQLQSAIGLLADNKAFTAEQFGRLRKGGYRLVPKEVVERLIRILDLDPYEAWPAAGVIPPGFTADHLRELRFFDRAPVGVTDRKPAIAGARILPWRPRHPLLPLPRPA